MAVDSMSVFLDIIKAFGKIFAVELNGIDDLR